MKEKVVAIYARVSTKKQNTLDEQVNTLKRIAEQNGWKVYDVYVDVASGRSMQKRPELKRMLKDIEEGRINAVMIYRFSRLGRSTKDLIDISLFLKKHNCDLYSYTERIDTTTPIGNFYFNVLAALSQFESDLISERIRDTYKYKKTQAEKLGKKVRWGRKMKLTKEEIQMAKEWKEKYNMSYRNIAREINRKRAIKGIDMTKKENIVSHTAVRNALMKYEEEERAKMEAELKEKEREQEEEDLFSDLFGGKI